MNEKIKTALYVLGATLILAGAATYITAASWSAYAYMSGAVVFASVQLADRYGGHDFIMRRLRFQQVLGALFLLLSGLLMLSSDFRVMVMTDQTMNPALRGILLTLTSRNSWIVTLSVAALFELYSVFRMESRSRELQEKP